MKEQLQIVRELYRLPGPFARIEDAIAAIRAEAWGSLLQGPSKPRRLREGVDSDS